MDVTVTCDWCKQEFIVPHWRATKENICCSRKCATARLKSKQELNCTCEICGKTFHRKESQKKKNNNNFCSVACLAEWKRKNCTGENNHQYGKKGILNSSWKSDIRISTYGYVLVRQLNHPFRNGDDFVFEHRLVAEKFLLNDENSIEIDGKKYLSPNYIVHHIDENRTNNNAQNLQVMSLSEHTSLHNILNPRDRDELGHFI